MSKVLDCCLELGFVFRVSDPTPKFLRFRAGYSTTVLSKFHPPALTGAFILTSHIHVSREGLQFTKYIHNEVLIMTSKFVPFSHW